MTSRQVNSLGEIQVTIPNDSNGPFKGTAMSNKSQQRDRSEAEPEDAKTLEQRIAVALGNPVAVEEMYELIDMTDAAIEEAEAVVREQQSAAYDPALSPDLHAAREAIERMRSLRWRVSRCWHRDFVHIWNAS